MSGLGRGGPQAIGVLLYLLLSSRVLQNSLLRLPRARCFLKFTSQIRSFYSHTYYLTIKKYLGSIPTDIYCISM